jgi:hypothetical protein
MNFDSDIFNVLELAEVETGRAERCMKKDLGVTNCIHQNGHHPLASISARMLT